jgi:hypothetical protein
MKKFTFHFGLTMLLCQVLLFAGLDAKAVPSTLPKQGMVLINETFNDSLYNWKVLNLNGGKTWVWFNGAATYLLDQNLPGDDWLFSPSFSLSKDSVYELSFSATAYTRPENFKVALISDNTADTVTLADYPSFTSDQSGTIHKRIVVANTGKYHLGWFEYSEPNMHRLEIDNVLLEQLSLLGAPDSVTDVKVVIDKNGSLADTLSFKAPSFDMSGKPLSAITSIKVFRNNDSQMAAEFTNPAVGSSISWTDKALKSGFNTYYIYAENNYGISGIDSVTTYVGADTPSKLDKVVAKLNADRSITLNWNAVKSTVHSGYLDVSKLKYKIERDGQQIALVQDTSFTESNPEDESQRIITYQVTPMVDSLAGETTASNGIIDGIPLDVPYTESFKNGKYQVSDWLSRSIQGSCEWTVSGDDEDYEIYSVDSDHGMIICDNGYANPGDSTLLISPMLDISKMNNPKLTFYLNHNQSPYYDPENDGEQNDRVQVQLSRDGGDFVNVDNGEFYNSHDSKGWTKCEVHLAGVNAKFVNIGLLSVPDNMYRNMYIDSVSITNDVTYDLKADSLAGPKRVDANTTNTFVASIINYGATAVSDYQVKLYKDGNLYAEQKGVEIAPAKKAKFSFDVASTMADAQNGGNHQYQLFIDYTNDENHRNDTTSVFESSVRTPEYPVATGLRGNVDTSSSTANLVWNKASSIASEKEGDVKVVTDGFDTYTPYIIDSIGDWTVVDRDGDATLASPRMPNYLHKGDPMAFQVFNNTEVVTVDDVFESHSGSQYLISPCGNTKQNDDWLISPQLNGHAQTVNFWAKAATYDSERIIVYYSTTDKNPDSFVKLSEGDYVFVHENWTNYSYSLPEGAKYFAVRYVSNKIVMLFLDDFTYTAYNGGHDAMNVLGYNIYRNGKQLNTSLITGETFADNHYSKGDMYNVTVVYDKGESNFSENAALTVDGITSRSVENVNAYSCDGNIVIDGANGHNISVYTMTGALVYRTSCGTSRLSVGVGHGSYIVVVDNQHKKLMVK